MPGDELHVRIQMADEKIEALKNDIALFCENQRPNIKITREGRGGSATLPPVSIPIGWRVRIGVIAYLLRSSLDHLVWDLVLQNGNTPSRRNQFPISDDVLSLPPNTDENLKGLSRLHDQVIREFSGLNPNINNFPLLDLNAICNVDKHRHPHQTCAMVTELSEDYRRRELQCSEQGHALPEVGRGDLVIRVCFQDARKVPREKRKLQGEVIGKLETCSATVKGVIDNILDGVPVSWPFILDGKRSRRPSQTPETKGPGYSIT